MGVASQDNEVDRVQERTHDLQSMSAVPEEVGLTAPISSEVIFEVVDVPSRSSPQLVPLDYSSLTTPAVVTSAPSPLHATFTEQISCFAPTSQIAIAANTMSDLGASAVSFLDLYETYTRARRLNARSRPSIEDGYTFGADHTRTSSDATTLMGTSLRDVLSLQSSADFQRRLSDAHELISQVQGLQDRRAIERDQLEAEDRVLGLDNEHVGPSNGKPTSLGHQSKDFKALFLEAKKDGEEQVKTYEFLLAKAEQDGKIALEEREDEYDDEVKDLKKDLDNVTKELEDTAKELEDAAHKNIVIERRLKKALRERETFEEAAKALTEKCKALREDAAHKDEQLSAMSSILHNRQEQLQALSGRYNAASTAANGNARLVERNDHTIIDLRQTVQVLAGQLTQHQQGPAAALVDSLRNENGRLLGVISEDQTLLGTATAKIAALTEALRQAKRDHDRWFIEFPEHSLSNPTKIANHLVYKDRLYEDLEKRFHAYTTANEDEQKKAQAYKDEAEKYIKALIKALEMQNEAVNTAKKDKEAYLMEMSRILTTSLDQLRRDELIEGLTFHFNLVQRDNFALATRVTELDEEMDGLKQKVTGHEREQEDLLKKLEAQQEVTHQSEEAKRTAMGEVDALKYTMEVVEEGHKAQVANYETSLAELESELKTMGDRFCAVNHESASERIRFELESKDKFIQTLRDRLNQCNQAYIQASHDRDSYKRALDLDVSLEYFDNCNVSFLQRQLCISEENYAKVQADLDDVHLRNVRDRRLSKEALDEEKRRVQELEKELHELYRNLQARASQAPVDTPADTPPRATTSKPVEDKNAAIEDLAGRLWSCLRGLEMALEARGIRALDHDNEREKIRLACEQLLGLRDVEEDGSPRSTATVEDVRGGNVGNDEPNGEHNDSDDNLGEEDATEDDTEAQMQGDYALAEALINDACDTLGYAPGDPSRAEEIQRPVYGRSGVVEAGEGAEGVEIALGLNSSTDAVLGEDEEQDEEQDGWEEVEDPVGGVGQEEASQSSTDGDSATTTTDKSEASSRADDDRTVTQADYNATAAATTTPERPTPESSDNTVRTSPSDEEDPDDSMDMSPGTWARRYAPPFMYGEPIEDDMF